MTSQEDLWAGLSVRQRLGRMAPFLLAFGVAFALALLTRSELVEPWLVVAALALTVLTAVLICCGFWSRLPEVATLAPVVSLCAAVFLLRAGSGGGSTAGYGALLYVLVVWQAMRRRHRDLLLTIAAVTATNVASVLWLASPATVAAQWRAVVLSSVVAAGIGETIFRLVQERARLAAQVADLALRDTLTGLGNRRTWDERVPALAAAAARSGRPLAVAVIDLDHFKAYNDERGHDGGDALLVAAAAAWREVVRGSDLLVRWGGEEFALLLPDTDAVDAADVLARLRAVVPDGQSFSAGYTVATFHPDIAVDVAHLVRRADEALYAAKAAGRGRSIGAHGVAPAPMGGQATGSGVDQLRR